MNEPHNSPDKYSFFRRACDLRDAGDLPAALAVMDEGIHVIESNGKPSFVSQLRRARMADDKRVLYASTLPIIEKAVAYYHQQGNVLGQIDMLLHLASSKNNPDPSVQVRAAESLVRDYMRDYVATHGDQPPPFPSLAAFIVFRYQEIKRLKLHYGIT